MLFVENMKEKVKIIHRPITQRQMLTFWCYAFLKIWLITLST